MDQDFDKFKNYFYVKIESDYNIKKLKYDLYNEIFSCVEKFKSKYKNSSKKHLISEIYENIVKSDISSYFVFSYDNKFQNYSHIFENKNKDYFRKIKLYHYTSMEAFNSITQSNSLLFSNVQDMNDSLECKLYFDIIKKDLQKKDLPDKTIQAVSELFYKKLNDVFVFSLSAEDDDAAQWERYANKGEGVCLVTSIFDALIWLVNQVKKPLVTPVEYVSRETSLNRIINHSFDDYKSLFEQISDFQNKSSETNVFTALQRLVSDCCRIKERSFRNEKEFRLIAFENNSIDQKNNSSRINIFDNQKFIRTKLELGNIFSTELRNFKKLANPYLFSEAILGPKSKADPIVVHDYLRNVRQIDVKVSKSNSSLR